MSSHRSTPAYAMPDNCPAFAWDGHSIYARDNASIEAVVKMQRERDALLAAARNLSRISNEIIVLGMTDPEAARLRDAWAAMEAAIASAIGAA